MEPTLKLESVAEALLNLRSGLNQMREIGEQMEFTLDEVERLNSEADVDLSLDSMEDTPE